MALSERWGGLPNALILPGGGVRSKDAKEDRNPHTQDPQLAIRAGALLDEGSGAGNRERDPRLTFVRCLDRRGQFTDPIRRRLRNGLHAGAQPRCHLAGLGRRPLGLRVRGKIEAGVGEAGAEGFNRAGGHGGALSGGGWLGSIACSVLARPPAATANQIRDLKYPGSIRKGGEAGVGRSRIAQGMLRAPGQVVDALGPTARAVTRRAHRDRPTAIHESPMPAPHLNTDLSDPSPRAASSRRPALNTRRLARLSPTRAPKGAGA